MTHIGGHPRAVLRHPLGGGRGPAWPAPGVPAARASAYTRPNGSGHRLGNTSPRLARNRSSTSCRPTARRISTRLPRAAACTSSHSRTVPHDDQRDLVRPRANGLDDALLLGQPSGVQPCVTARTRGGRQLVGDEVGEDPQALGGNTAPSVLGRLGLRQGREQRGRPQHRIVRAPLAEGERQRGHPGAAVAAVEQAAVPPAIDALRAVATVAVQRRRRTQGPVVVQRRDERDVEALHPSAPDVREGVVQVDDVGDPVGDARGAGSVRVRWPR